MTEKDLALIDKYIRQECTSEEISSIKELQQDENFRLALEERSLLAEVIKDRERTNMKNQLQDLEAVITEQKDYIKIIRRYLMPLAASIALVFAMWHGLNTDVSTDLYNNYYQPYPNLIAPITKGSNDMNPYQLYELERYREAIDLLENKENENAEWYTTQSYIKIEEYDTSLILLDQIIKNNSHSYRQEALWYKALVMIKTNKKEAAQSLLTTISSDEENPYSGSATKLLIDMQ